MGGFQIHNQIKLIRYKKLVFQLKYFTMLQTIIDSVTDFQSEQVRIVKNNDIS